MKETSVPLPALFFSLTFTVLPPSVQVTSSKFPPDQVLPWKDVDKKLVAAEPTPFVPIVTRSSSNDVPALTLVHAATGLCIFLLDASSCILS